MVNAYFLDSSALVKRYVPEIGSAWIIELDQALAESAGQLVNQYPLRAYDAVQLGSEDVEPWVDLQGLLHEIYEQGAYDLRLDYSRALVPALSEADMA